MYQYTIVSNDDEFANVKIFTRGYTVIRRLDNNNWFDYYLDNENRIAYFINSNIESQRLPPLPVHAKFYYPDQDL